MTTPKKAILYLHVSANTKRWLKRLCAKQVGKISQSTMAEQVFVAAQKLGIFDRGTQSRGKNGKNKVQARHVR